jgi:hypothetical protein
MAADEQSTQIPLLKLLPPLLPAHCPPFVWVLAAAGEPLSFVSSVVTST